MKHISILLVIWSSVQGSVTVINTAKETACIGSNVTLLCQLMTSEPNVIQITWQKESGNFTGTVATTSKTYGQKLLGYYFNRATHSTNKTLNVSAITISSVTPEDEGCFKCIFNLFPLGASTGTTCLKVYEANLLEPKLEVQEIIHPETLEKLHLVTCSATGKPAPKITWKLPENLDTIPENYTIIDINNAELVISNFTMSSIQNKVPVTCVVHHPSLSSERHLFTVIDGPGDPSSNLIFLSVILAIIFLLLVIFMIKHLDKRKKYMRPKREFMQVTI